MQKKEPGFAGLVCLALACCVTIFAGSALAATEKVLHSFTGTTDGSQPDAGLTPGPKGSFYGSTFYGGTANQGVIYQLTLGASGWTETVLYNFQGGSADGANPFGTLAIDAAGNIYGTTASGGRDYGKGGSPGNGIVYELSPSPTGWKETIIHFFYHTPSSGLVMDGTGNLYGETGGGGSSNAGTVFQMKPMATGWSYRAIYSFAGATNNDGNYPWGGVIFDRKGNLYGATIQGGTNYSGSVFELKPQPNGTWIEDQLYVFQNTADGVFPEGSVIFDKAGNLYGTTLYGGDVSCAQGYGCGLVFELSPNGGSWSKTTLYDFTGAPDGHAPDASMTFDKAGNLWGTTSNGGSNNSGALFELKPQAGGTWQESIVYSFLDGSDGGYPSTPLLIDGKGNIWGTTQVGGAFTEGVAYEFPGVAAR
jgi:uncharacterized repeat protein (TIGR03803 family)